MFQETCGIKCHTAYLLSTAANLCCCYILGPGLGICGSGMPCHAALQLIDHHSCTYDACSSWTCGCGP